MRTPADEGFAAARGEIERVGSPVLVLSGDGLRFEIHRMTIPGMGSEYRIVFDARERERPFALEFRAEVVRGPEDEWSAIGGGGGLPNAEYRTLGAALCVLAELDHLGPAAIENEAWWGVYEKYEGR